MTPLLPPGGEPPESIRHLSGYATQILGPNRVALTTRTAPCAMVRRQENYALGYADRVAERR